MPAFAPGLSGASYPITFMTAETTTPPTEPTQASGPLFYRQPLPLQSDKHANWRLRPGSLAFAAETNAIPAVIGYNRYSHIVNSFEARLQRFADRFHASLSRELDGL